jgi:hypothetical protein
MSCASAPLGKQGARALLGKLQSLETVSSTRLLFGA